ncbi:hypothetical protein [Rhizobium leguminosarum]|uniref:hypothetical protein n=1 Tax=Rhizobium leguminosarum TaxID=384 RepID=UPI001A92F845|nr:hypothetical protein [Rhizobium leguminosarum]MBY5554131.1 hypothetical protein [Rhizobium leguminosarum]MBY5723557.1 hypothetical protein [Rhizobium leguminosarum]QSW27250.1 hypothetical protein J0664_30960 [Rhizobium leguminosarum]
MQKEPPINPDNLYVLINSFFHAVAFFLPPFAVIIFVSSAISIGWSYCSPADFTGLPRVGAVVQGITFFYVFFEELWQGPRSIAGEIEHSFALLRLDSRPSSTAALKKYRAFSHFTVRVHRVLVRSVEAMLVIVGTVLSAFGDLVGRYLYGIV